MPNRPCWPAVADIPALPLWRVVALTLDIDTANINPVSTLSGVRYDVVMGWVARFEEFKRRMDIALSYANSSTEVPFCGSQPGDLAFDFRYVDIVAFGEWARGKGWSLPSGYPQRITTDAREFEARPPPEYVNTSLGANVSKNIQTHSIKTTRTNILDSVIRQAIKNAQGSSDAKQVYAELMSIATSYLSATGRPIPPLLGSDEEGIKYRTESDDIKHLNYRQLSKRLKSNKFQ